MKLSESEDRSLQEVEGNAGSWERVRLRARAVRLSHYKLKAEKIAEYIGKSKATVLRYFDCWERGGLEGLADG